MRYGKGQNMMGLLTTEMTHVDQKAGMISWLLNFIKHPIRNLAYFFPRRWSERGIFLLVMQPLNNYLRLVHEKKWWKFGGVSINR